MTRIHHHSLRDNIAKSGTETNKLKSLLSAELSQCSGCQVVDVIRQTESPGSKTEAVLISSKQSLG